jgi:hypothetical protein
MDTITRAPVTAEARGKARLLLAEAAAGAAQMERAFARIPKELMNGRNWRGAKGSERAIQKIRGYMPRPPDLSGNGMRLVGWRYLAVLPAIPGDEADPPQSCLAVRAIIAQHKKPGRGAELFGLVVSLHAIERAYQRAPEMDVAAAIFTAHDALLALESEGEQVFALSGFPLPCAGGLFRAQPRHVGPERSPVAICHTFITNDMSHFDQERDAAEWRRLIEVSRRSAT